VSLRNLLAQAARLAFTVADDIPERCLYTHADRDVDYDTSTGEVLPDDGTSELYIDFLFPTDDTDEKTGDDGDLAPTGTIKATALTAQFHRRPARGDTLLRGLDQLYVLGVKPDISRTLYKFRCPGRRRDRGSGRSWYR
jgi:hypothetical protein